MDIVPEKNKIIRYARTYLPFWRKPQIGFYENLGHGDLGDDTAFYVAQKVLGVSLMPLSKRCYDFYPRALKGLLIGGRGVFHAECPYVPRRILERKKWPFPVVLFAAGVNCDYDREVSPSARDMIMAVCERCDYISVRDRLSRDFLESMGIKGVRILPDLELAAQPEPVVLPVVKNAPCIGITVTPHGAFDDKMVGRIIENMAGLVEHATAKGFQVVFFLFDQRSSDSGRERKIVAEIMARVSRRDRVVVLDKDLSAGQMVFAIAHLCDAMVCMRLHSMAFAAGAGVPFLPIGFNRMHRAFFEMLSLEDREISVFQDFSRDAVVAGFEKLMSDREGLKNGIEERTAGLKRQIHEVGGEVAALLAVR